MDTQEINQEANKIPDGTATYSVTTQEEIDKNYIALECLKIMLNNPAIMDKSFEVIADFAFRQAEAFVSRSKETEV